MYRCICWGSAKTGRGATWFLSFFEILQVRQRSARTRKSWFFSVWTFSRTKNRRKSGTKRRKSVFNLKRRTSVPFGMSEARNFLLLLSSSCSLPVFWIGSCVQVMTLHCQRKSILKASELSQHIGEAVVQCAHLSSVLRQI